MCASMRTFQIFGFVTLCLNLLACGAESAITTKSVFAAHQGELEVIESTLDLVIVASELEHTVVQPGDLVRADALVGNQGATPASASQLRYMLSADATLDSDDKYLNYDHVSALEAGETGAEWANLRIPASWPLGGAYVLVVADFKAVVAESNEANNVEAIAIEIVQYKEPEPGDLPELAVQNTRLSTTVILQDDVLQASADVVNQGLGISEGSQLRYYLSTRPTFDAEAIYLNYDRVSMLESSAKSQEEANLRIPADLESGEYFVLFVADAKGEVSEADETNNVLARPISVGEEALSGQSDLAIASVQLTSEMLYPGQSLSAEVFVQNVGTGLSGEAMLRYFLSSDSDVSSDDVEIGSGQVAPLGPDASRLESAQLVIHESTRVGSYKVLAQLETDEDESGAAAEDNNLRSADLLLSKDQPDAVLPDLQLAEVQLSAPVALAGERVSISLKVVNGGVLQAESSRLKYYLSTKDFYDADASYLNYDAVSALEANGSSPEDANLRMPAALADGRYYILVVADDTDAVQESIESNNLLALAIDVGEDAVETYYSDREPEPASERPDLRLTLTTAPQRDFAPGEQVPLSLTISNVGSAAAVQSRIKYFISRDPVYDAFDKYGGYDRVAALGVGEEESESGNPRVPADAQGGLWYVLAVADANNDVEESEEENNVLAVPFMVDVDMPDAALADLVISEFTLDEDRPQPNAQTRVELTVANQGVDAAATSRLKFYWSADEHYDAQDRFLDYRQVPSLGVGEDIALSATLRIPHGSRAGGHYILTVLDVGGVVSERFESNNIYPSLVTVDPMGRGEAPNAYGCSENLTMDPTINRDVAIGAMNVLHLGWDNGKDFDGLACVLSHFAITALNEVESEEALQILEAALEARTGEGWSYHISPEEVGSADGKEYYAFIWRDDRITFQGSVGFFDDPLGVIKRDPYGANFKMDAFDFTLVAFHQRNGGSISIRRAEAEHFADIVSFFQSANGAEDDLLIGGDFNLPGNDPAFTAVGWNGVTYSVDHEQPTSISDAGLRNSFDNIFYQSQHLTELRAAGVLDFTRGNHAELRWLISDHIPVWIEVDSSADLD